jgi:DNA-binding NarL/FixJ family response regulator
MSMGGIANGKSLPITFSVPSRLAVDVPDTPDSISLPGSYDRSLLIVDSRALDRECFAKGLVAGGIGMNVLHAGSLSDFNARENIPPVAAVVLNIGGKKISDPLVVDEIRKLCFELKPKPVILLADTDELTQILQALECGVRGFIPTSVGIDVCIEAIGLAIAGGVFVPASSVFAMRRLVETASDSRPLDGMFTPRQAEVVEALRRGKANKIIAYELNLRESTVKVHIRNIMRKLKATNRTEVAFKINELFPGYVPDAMPHPIHIG